MSWGIIIISIILACFFHGEVVGRIFMFLAFISVMCSLFGSYIPFADIIIEGANFISVMIMIGLGAIFIFIPTNNQKDSKNN